jgi:hypothetical protein
MACIYCGRGFHDECERGCPDCHGEEDSRISNTISNLVGSGGPGRPALDPSQVTDRYSTGRKRAAALYPLNNKEPCEWRNLKNCGGGVPVIGCLNGFQQDRHHGPVKDTLRNERENVHLICKKCHKRWHYFNDPVYLEEKWDDTSHEPVPATEAELRAFELKWSRTTRSHVLIDSED